MQRNRSPPCCVPPWSASPGSSAQTGGRRRACRRAPAARPGAPRLQPGGGGEGSRVEAPQLLYGAAYVRIKCGASPKPRAGNESLRLARTEEGEAGRELRQSSTCVAGAQLPQLAEVSHVKVPLCLPKRRVGGWRGGGMLRRQGPRWCADAARGHGSRAEPGVQQVTAVRATPRATQRLPRRPLRSPPFDTHPP